MADKEFIMKYLKEKNYWWDTLKVTEEDIGIIRGEYIKIIEKELKLDRIIGITGIRRAGKTTIMFQMIEKLIKIKPPKRIVYVKIDDIIDKFENLKEIVDSYYELSGSNPKEEEIFFFFDEIQLLEGWQIQIKFFIDGKYKSKFIISGSSKTLLYKDASESLVGRIRFVEVFPLTFSEFLTFNKFYVETKKIDMTKPDFQYIKKNYLQLIDKKEKIIYLLNQYLKVGGFPEWFKIKDKQIWQRVLRDDYFSLMLFKDIVHIFKPKDPLLLEKLSKEIATFSTNRFSYLKLANRFDVDRETIKLYLYYLKATMLIFISEIYTKNKKTRERSEKKVYFGEEGLRKSLTSDDEIGKSIENVIALHLIKEGLRQKVFFQPYYWKNKKEVDFIFEGEKNICPIEVKYKEYPSDVKGLLEFCNIYKTTPAFIITKDVLEMKEYTVNKMKVKVILIPSWLFLLML